MSSLSRQLREQAALVDSLVDAPRTATLLYDAADALDRFATAARLATSNIAIREALAAYDSQNLNVGGPRPNDDTGARPADLDKRGHCVAGKGGCDSWRGHVEGCTADLNSAKQEGE